MKSVFVGWICRNWIETTEGWKFKINRFKTEEEALKCGYEHNNGINGEELSREFEVYKDYELVRRATI